MTLIPYSRQWIDEDDINAVVDILRSDLITQGPKIEEFESALSSYCGSKHAVVFSSGTAALHAAYSAAGISPGDEIITSPMTFAATANAAIYLGAMPVFVDIERDTGNINPELIEKAISKKTKAIVSVHYAGHPADIDAIHCIAKKHDILVIEDACHALGARYRSQKKKNNWIRIGSCKYSDMTVFSFHPVKHITTGEGGAVLTDNARFYEKLLMFRSHGITKKRFLNKPHGDWYYEMHFLGYNYRLTDIQAALGISQLKKLDRFVERRRKIADVYNKALKNNPNFDIPVEMEYAFSSYHLYPIKLKDEYRGKKKEIFEKLRSKKLGVQVHYIPVYLHPYYQESGCKKGLCGMAENFYEREISMPVYPAMSDGDVYAVIDAIDEVFKDYDK